LDVVSKVGKVEEIKTFVEERLTILNDLGRYPIYFRSNNLYNNTRCFCYELGEILANWDKSINRFREIWYKKVYEYYKQIFEEVFELVWRPQYRPQEKKLEN